MMYLQSSRMYQSRRSRSAHSCWSPCWVRLAGGRHVLYGHCSDLSFPAIVSYGYVYKRQL